MSARLKTLQWGVYSSLASQAVIISMWRRLRLSRNLCSIATLPLLSLQHCYLLAASVATAQYSEKALHWCDSALADPMPTDKGWFIKVAHRTLHQAGAADQSCFFDVPGEKHDIASIGNIDGQCGSTSNPQQEAAGTLTNCKRERAFDMKIIGQGDATAMQQHIMDHRVVAVNFDVRTAAESSAARGPTILHA